MNPHAILRLVLFVLLFATWNDRPARAQTEEERYFEIVESFLDAPAGYAGAQAVGE